MTSLPLDGIRSSQETQAAPQSYSETTAHPDILAALAAAKKQQEWATWVNNKYQECKSARSQAERQWYINLAFIAGRQYVAPVDVPGYGFRLTAPRAPSWRVRLVVNKIRTAVRTECAKLSSSRPIPTVIPATNEDEDFASARVGEQLLRNAFANADFEMTYRSFIWWGVATGTSYLKSFWDAGATDPEAQNPPQPAVGIDGQPLTGPDGQPIMQPAEVVKGAIRIERVTPFHIYVPDLLTEDLNKQPYLMHVSTRNPIWVEKAFGFKPTCDARATSTIMEAAVLTNKGTQDHLDSVLVKEVWLKKDAHPDFPEGGVLTVINDRVVQSQASWPWPFEEYPFYKYSGIPTGGYYADSVVVDLIPIQKEYNRTKSQMIEIKNTMGKPKLLYAKGSVNPRQISSEPGQGVPYTAGYPAPIVMPGAEIPATMGIELDRLSSDFDDISGQHEITRGNTPAQVTSGTAIAFLQEQDDSKLSYQVASIEYCIEKLGKHYLKYVATYWDAPRLIKITGKDSTFEAMHWKGSDLRGNTDVKVQTGSALPVSKAARQAMITEFMQNGWIDPASGLEILELGGFDKVMDDFLVDKRQAQRENMKMSELPPEVVQQALNPQPMTDPATGQPVTGPDGLPVGQDGGPLVPQPPIPVNSWDDHEQHIHFHNQFRKTQQFELLDDTIKQAFEYHVQMHQMALVQPQVGIGGNVVANEQPPMYAEEPGGEAGADPNGGSGPPPQGQQQ